jgi:tight adherence protein B
VRRIGPLLAVAVLLGAAAPSAVALKLRPFELRHVDVAGYPYVRVVARSILTRPRPRVYENGKPVAGSQVLSLGRSKAIVLAIDRSQSMAGRPLARAGAAASVFLHLKRQSDRVAVVSFGSTALAQTHLGQATIDADTALRGLSTDRRVGTAFYDAVILSASELRRQPLAGRVLVLLTDGRDVGSLATLGQAVRAARRANAIVYTIGLGHADRAPLSRLARATGGAFYRSATPAALLSIYRRIASDLDRTWTISYTTAARPGESFSVAVGDAKGPTGRPVSVTVPGSSPTPYRSWIPRTLARSIWGSLLVALVAAVLVFFLVRQARSLPRGERVKRLVRAHTDPVARPSRGPRTRGGLASLLTGLDRRLRGFQQWGRIERLVERAGAPVSPPTLLVAGLGVALILSLLTAIATESSFFVVVAFGLGLVSPFVALHVRATRRIRAFDNQLPDALATIANSLRVGHGLKVALQAVAEEGQPPASEELRRVLAEARLGRPLEEALVAMCERLASEDLLYIATAVDVQSQAGGSLAGVFTTVAETVRQRQQHRRRVRALTASGRATATVLSILPFALLALLALINPDYMMPFIRSSLGHVLLVASAISIAIGALLLNRIASVKG